MRVTKPRKKTERLASLRSSNRVDNLYRWIRTAILNGRIVAGESINQAQLATQFAVSRTPIREALRMLQAEGLVVGELNQRMHVAHIIPADVDSLYATRILLECFGLAITIPRLTRDEIAKIREAVAQMSAHVWTGDRQAWEVHHARFHGMLVMHVHVVAGSILADMIANFQLRSERIRRLYVGSDPQATTRALDEHERIAEAVAAKSVAKATRHLAHHYANAALSALQSLAPDYQPTSLLNSLAVVDAGAFEGDYQELLAAIAGTSRGALLPLRD